jgi:hypothetical protein
MMDAKKSGGKKPTAGKMFPFEKSKGKGKGSAKKGK